MSLTYTFLCSKIIEVLGSISKRFDHYFLIVVQCQFATIHILMMIFDARCYLVQPLLVNYIYGDTDLLLAAAFRHRLNFVRTTACSCIKPLIGEGLETDRLTYGHHQDQARRGQAAEPCVIR